MELATRALPAERSAQPAEWAGVSVLASTRVVSLVSTVAAVVTLVFGHTEHAESLLFWFAFLVALPLAVVRAGQWAGALSPAEARLAARTSVALVASVIVAARAVDAFAGRTAMLVLVAAGMTLIVLAENRLGRPVDLRGAGPASVVLSAGAVAAFVPRHAFGLQCLASSVLVGLGVAVLLYVRPARQPRWSRRVIDVCACLLVAIAVTDLSAYGVRLAPDEDFYLGPANAILHGSAMLVDTFAQYGVGVMYFLAGAFLVVPLGYGGFQLVNGLLTAFGLVVIYVVLRLATRNQRDAVVGVVVIAVANVLTGAGPHVGYGSVGWLRFGLPWLVVLSTLLELRGTRRAVRGLTLALLALASIWSFETFVYSAAAWVAFSVVRAVLDGERERGVARLRNSLAAACGVVIGTQIAFALITLAAAGSWPAWGGYLVYVRLYSWGGFGTLLIPPWSLGYVLAAVYAVSFAALCVMLRLAPELCAARRAELAAIASLSAFGTLSYTYFLGRSHPNNLHHVAPPAIALAVVWLGVLRDLPGSRDRLRLVVVVAGLAAGMLVMQQTHETASDLRSSPYGYGVHLPGRTVGRAHALLRDRPDAPIVVQGAREVDRLSPRGNRVAVVLTPEIQTQTLIRAHRGNALPVAIPHQASLLPRPSLALVRRRLGRLAPGSVVLTQPMYLAELRRGRHLSFQGAVLAEIGKRFEYRVTLLEPPRFALLTIDGVRSGA